MPVRDRQCPADIDDDGAVNALDLIAVIAAWGQAGVPEDVIDDGVVDVLDLIEIVVARGPCA